MPLQSIQRSATSSTYSTNHPSAHLSSLHSVQQSCAIATGCACRVTSISDFFFMLAGCQHAKQKDVLVVRFFFSNSVLNCHDARYHKHTKFIFIAAQASLRHKSVDLRHLHFWSRLLQDLHSVTVVACVIMNLSLELLESLDSSPPTSHRLSGDYPRRPTQHLSFL